MREEIQATFIHSTALHFGDVRIGNNASLWPYSVIRAEMHHVQIGAYTNIQDHVMIHVGEKTPTVIGDYCSITHRAVIHGANIGDCCLIGIGAIVMDGCVIGENSIIDAGVMLPANTIIPPNSIVKGNPGKVVRTRNNFVNNKFNAMMYYHNAEAYKLGKHDLWGDESFKMEGRKLFKSIMDEAKK